MSSAQGQPPPNAGASTESQETGRHEASRQEAGRQYVPRQAPRYDEGTRRPRGFAGGLTIAAAVMLMLSGLWDFFEGLAAIIRGSFFVVLPNYAYNISVSGWGWFHLIMGVVVFLTGACLFMDMLWARVAGIVIAAASAVINFLYIPYQPVWSIVVIAIDLAVIWALLTPRYERA
jgi:hypothetical protein